MREEREEKRRERRGERENGQAGRAKKKFPLFCDCRQFLSPLLLDEEGKGGEREDKGPRTKRRETFLR